MLSTRLQRITPYVPGEQPQDRAYTKLNTNENPYPPSSRVSRLLADYDVDSLRRYPDPLCMRLRAAASELYGIPIESIFAGNGSDEVLSFAHFAFFDKSAAFPDPSYSFYPVYCDYYGIKSIRVPLDAEMGIDLEALASTESDGITIANPNSPTGMYVERDRIESMIDSYPKDRIVIVDEAYIAFGGESCLPLIENYPNLLVIYTFSKSASLAGLRLGLAFGNPILIDALFRTKDAFNSYPVHDLAQRIGVAALEEHEYYAQNCEKIIATREHTSKALRSLGWSVLPSKSNFLFASHPNLSGGALYEYLRDHSILVRYFDHPRLDKYIRLTIGTDEEMELFLREISNA